MSTVQQLFDYRTGPMRVFHSYPVTGDNTTVQWESQEPLWCPGRWLNHWLKSLGAWLQAGQKGWRVGPGHESLVSAVLSLQ